MAPEVQQAHGGAADEFFAGEPQAGGYNAERAPQYESQHGYYQPSPPVPGNHPQVPFQGHQPQPNGYQQQNYYNNGYQNPFGGDQTYDAPPPVQGEKMTFEQAFPKPEKEQKFKDWWAALLFLATFAGFIAVSGLCLRGYVVTTDGSKNNQTFGLNRMVIVLLAYVLAVAFVFSYGYLWLVRKFTKQIVWITGILQIAFGIGTAVFYLWAKQYAAGIVFLVFAVFYIICFISWIPRIPFSVLMLQTVIDVAKHYGHVFIVSLVGGAIATAFGAWFVVTLVAVYAKYTPNNASCNEVGGCSRARVIGLIVFITFAGYWITEVLKNVIHVTISGVYGSWYFHANSAEGMPKGITRGALKRATTYSFGSISFGSLLVALVQLLRQACTIARSNASQEGDFIGTIFFCVLQCFIGLLEWLITFFNEYAFSFIALYGKAYIPAAKSTWHMMRDRGVDALVNECLINPVLTMGSIFVAYCCVLLSYLYLRYGNVEMETSYYAVIMAYSFLVGLQIANTFLVPLKSGVSTLFVAMAFDPQVLQRRHGDLWNNMVHVFPKVQTIVQPHHEV